jgi:microsomal dipeptidase-like Zn-dependent dipeptidase
MIADLHCHFPMHRVAWEETHPHGHVVRWWERIRRDVTAEAFDLVARLVDHPAFGAGWGVDLDGLEEGGAGIVCSVLYWPFCEFQLPYGAPPDPAAFDCLVAQLDDVEAHLADVDPDGTRHVVVGTEADLDDASRIRFVHCVEGGFHLGPKPADVDGQIRTLAERGVFYITLAHLFYRGVAADAPAVPPLTDDEYDRVFHQPEEGLSELGRAAIEAMYRHKVVVDLSHMRRDAISDTLDCLRRLDPDGTMPVIASHVGAATAGPPGHAYNLTDQTMRAIRERGGVIGLIAAQHLLGPTKSPEDSRALLKRHIEAVRRAVGDDEHTAIGTDLDGFINPTLTGLKKANDLARLQAWIRDVSPDSAEAILHGNVEGVLRRTLRLRAGAGT